MKRFRRKFPRTFPFACAAVGGAAGWGIGVLAAKLSPWAGVALLLGMVLALIAWAVVEQRESRRRVAVLRMIEQAIATRDRDLLEIAYLQMKYIQSPRRRRDRDRA